MKSGTLLQGRYRILRKLGSGGFAVTDLARDEETGRQVAVKHFSLSGAPDNKSVELFQREAEVLAGLDHPNIPEFIDYFQEETDRDIRIFLVQEYIPGRNLAERLRDGKRFTPREAAENGVAVLRILEYLHAFSPPIIHRDIKPTNIQLGDDGEVYLIDFGSVRDTLRRIDTLTPTVVGTFGYMPLEQFGGNTVPASDIFSLGATLVTLLSRREPSELPQKNFRLDFRPHVNVSRRMARTLDRMIDPRLERRFTRAEEARIALERLLLPADQARYRRMRNWSAALVLLAAIGVFFWPHREPMVEVSRERPESPMEAPRSVIDDRPALPDASVPEITRPPVVEISFDETLKGDGARLTHGGDSDSPVSFLPGKTGLAVHLDGGELEYVETQRRVFSAGYTIQFWFRVDQRLPLDSEGYHPVFRSGMVTFDIRDAGRSIVFLHGAQGGHMQMNLHESASPVVPVRWYHLAVSREAADRGMTAYLNGVRMDRIERFSLPPAERLDVIRLGGALRSNNRGFIGSLDELKIHDYARSPRQIAGSAASESAPSSGERTSGEEGDREVHTVSGELRFDGKLITEFTQAPARFWFRDEGTGKRREGVGTEYVDGTFYFYGLEPGKYGVGVTVPTNGDAGPRTPGNYKAWKTFSIIDPPGGALAIDLYRTIHLLTPQNNAGGLERWSARCEGKIAFPGPVFFSWKPVLENARYRYHLERTQCDPHQRLEVMAEGVTEQTEMEFFLPESGPNEFYLLRLSAHKDGKRVGLLETFGISGGRGWDYRFRVY